jgi:hypothetical protein
MARNLSLGLADDRVEKFAEDCVEFRNSIAHGDHLDSVGLYKDYITAVRKLADALSPLYHALLLLEIGLDAPMVRSWVMEIPPAFRRRWALAEAGLTEHTAR